MFTSLADLEQEFKKHQNAPLWTLYLGYSKQLKDRADNNEDVEDMDESWDQLRDSISRRSQAGGKFTIFQKANDKTNAGFTHKVDIKTTNGYNSPGISGIGMPGIGMMDVISDKLRIQELERDLRDAEDIIDDLKNGSMPGWLNNLLNGPHGEKVLEICAPLIQTAGVGGINAIMSIVGKNKIAGTPGQAQHTPHPPPQPGEESEFDERILPPLRKIARHMEIYTTLEAIANFVENDPETAKTILSNINSTV